MAEGGVDGCAALFLLEPLGLKGMKEEKAPAFALCMPSNEGHFVGVEPTGQVFRASIGETVSKDECGAFLLVQHGMPKMWLQACVGLSGSLTEKEAEKAVEKPKEEEKPKKEEKPAEKP